jgi:hypothetical protein
MRTRFQQGLDDLRQRLLRMGGLAEQAVDRARQAYVERDLTRCQMVLEGEGLINTAEREIDEAAFDSARHAAAHGGRPALHSGRHQNQFRSRARGRSGGQHCRARHGYGGTSRRRVAGRHRPHGRGRERHGAPRARVVHRRQGRTGAGRARNGQRDRPHARRRLHPT